MKVFISAVGVALCTIGVIDCIFVKSGFWYLFTIFGLNLSCLSLLMK